MGLNITEYAHIAAISNGLVPVGLEPSVARNEVAISGTAATSDPFNDHTRFVRLEATETCRVRFSAVDGTQTDAGVEDTRLFANTAEYFGVRPGMTVSVISSA